MAMKEQQRQVYRTAQGKEIDMHKLAMQNETTLAVGNVRMNARGDLLGPGGKIIKKQDESLAVPTQPIPNQINVRTESAVPAVPVVPAKKDVSNMDPEGNE
jgi:hypothetical protein